MALRERHYLLFPWPLMDVELPSAIVGVTGEDGKSIFDGKVATGFSNVEEKEIGWVDVSRRRIPPRTAFQNEYFQDVPFLLEDRIKSLGGTYEKADGLWGVRIVFHCFPFLQVLLTEIPCR